MQIVHMAKFVVAVAFVLGGIGLFVFARHERGVGKYRQAAFLCLIAAAIFGASGLGVGG